MNKNDFPYLTPDVVEAHEAELLNWLASLWPEHSPTVAIFGALVTLLPLMDHIPLVRQAVQTACDEWNKITGAEPPAI